MDLTPGTRLGPYEITGTLGAGGMGEVYLATDTRLDREVAVKILPAHLAERRDRLERFEREARIVSSLDHPHICTLYDIGKQDGIYYIVMENLKGETLAARLKKGRLPLDDVFRYAAELADALDQAHRKGVVHRDLKPGNIMLTHSGAVLLDFGLAKVEHYPVVGFAGQSATVDQVLTAEGTILGTLQYMAPEQLEGKPADARTDIFAFGALVYEMATGKRAFEAESEASLIGAIMTADPLPMASFLPIEVPRLDRVARVCLAKDPEDRWQSARDLVQEIEWVGEELRAGRSSLSHSNGRRTGGLALSLGAIALLLALALLTSIYMQPASPEGSRVEFSVSTPPTTSPLALQLALSPDGRHLAFVGDGPSGDPMLWVRPLDSVEALPLAGTEHAMLPFWSPDGRFLAFFTFAGAMKRVEISGVGGVRTICGEVPDPRGGTWNWDGIILFGSEGRPVQRVSADGGTPVRVTDLAVQPEVHSHMWPQFLPDGRHFIYLAQRVVPGDNAIYLASLDGGEPKRVIPADVMARVAPGQLLFVREQTLLAQPFDLGNSKVVGDARALADSVGSNLYSGLAAFSVSADGETLAYRAGPGVEQTELAWFDREGNPLGTLGGPGQWSMPRISPDGGRVVVQRQDLGAPDIWILAEDFATRLTFDPSGDYAPLWSPDGERILFASDRGADGAIDLYEKASDGSGEVELFLKSDKSKGPSSWPRPGHLSFFEFDPETLWDLWLFDPEGETEPVEFLRTPFNEVDGDLSPDGRWITYMSDESGSYEVYVQTVPPSGGIWQISVEGGVQPRWSADGSELFFLSHLGELMAVEVQYSSASATFTHETPLPLFQFNANLELQRNVYDFTPDGQRFLVNQLTGDPSESPLRVVLNWNGVVD